MRNRKEFLIFTFLPFEFFTPGPPWPAWMAVISARLGPKSKIKILVQAQPAPKEKLLNLAQNKI